MRKFTGAPRAQKLGLSSCKHDQYILFFCGMMCTAWENVFLPLLSIVIEEKETVSAGDKGLWIMGSVKLQTIEVHTAL